MTEEKKEGAITDGEVKIVKDLLSIISSSNISLGAREMEKESEKYKELVQKMIKYLYNRDVLEIELELYFQLMRQAISIAQNSLMASIELSKNMALENYWGKHPHEVTLKDIDSKMKKQDK